MQPLLVAVFSNPLTIFSCYSFIDDNIGQAVIQKYNSLESAIVEDVCTVVNFPAVFDFLLCANGN